MSAVPQKTALVTGVLGQDGSYLAELLLSHQYRVVGTTHRAIDSVNGIPGVELIQLNLADFKAISELLAEVQPDEVYNVAARSSSAQLFDDALATADINGLSAVRFLEAIRLVSPRSRFCQAASSEIFVGTEESPQSETTPLRPLNAYGAAKAYALHMGAAYRAQFGLHANTAILYNHESPRRGLAYVTRKITHTVALIEAGLAHELVLGSLDARRDWGFAGDYAAAMWRMLQQPEGGDFVIATGSTHSVEDFCAHAFSCVGLDYRDFVRQDLSLVRRVERVPLCGNPARAETKLGWQRSVSFGQLIEMMVQADRALVRGQYSV